MPRQRNSTIARAAEIRAERADDAVGRSGTEDYPLSAVPGIPPVNGIVAAFTVYACLVRLT